MRDTPYGGGIHASTAARMWYNDRMKTLIEANPFLHDRRTRERLLRENARQSSVFEGARGLPKEPGHPRSAKRRSKA